MRILKIQEPITLNALRFRLMHDGHLESQSVNGKWAKIHSRDFCIGKI